MTHVLEVSAALRLAHVSSRVLRSGVLRMRDDLKQLDQLDPLWERWTGSRDSRHWQPGTDFVRYYSGKILTSLSATDGQRMRRFGLLHPSSGKSGGGEPAGIFSLRYSPQRQLRISGMS